MTGPYEARTPISGGVIGGTRKDDADHVDAAVDRAHAAFLEWRQVPAPVRGTVVKRWGRLLEQHKEDLAGLVTAEVGKIRSEALGEVQEMIDVVDLAVGQSRQLFGKTMPSERSGHRLAETWHPLGLWGSSPPSTSRWPSTPGTPVSRSSPATPSCGSRPRARGSPPSL